MTINTAEKKKFPDPKSPDNPAAAGVYPPLRSWDVGGWEWDYPSLPTKVSSVGSVARGGVGVGIPFLLSGAASAASDDDGGDDDGDDVIAANNETPDYQSHFFHACAHTRVGNSSPVNQ